jgi:hypothetical protein
MQERYRRKHMPNAQNWLIVAQALESGEYTQATEALERFDESTNYVGNCCLGVACREAIKHGVNVKVTKGIAVTYFDDEPSALPHSVMSWLGADDSNPEISFVGEQVSLAELNDGMGRAKEALSLEEIAQVIRENFCE